ncbi:hypothetical protein DKX38_010646 [Salix brachista]|uniref:Coatomer subunit zeta n=1 Tax=Salix brachista TaxID=2182728 RepID=A0A5N5MDV1_9ROSI|nr:hypothetical protein DKX38_010646 [Salix brachista]
MLLAVLISNSEGNILIERFNGVPAEERSHWRSFLVKSGADNLKGARNEELFVASHKSVYVVYTVIGDVYLYVVGKDEYDELALAEVIFIITASIRDVCQKPPSERLFLDKYGRICLCLDEIVWKVLFVLLLFKEALHDCRTMRLLCNKKCNFQFMVSHHSSASCTVGNSSASRIRPSQQTQMPKFKSLLVPLRPDAVLDDHRNPNGYMEVCCRSTLMLHVVQ